MALLAGRWGSGTWRGSCPSSWAVWANCSSLCAPGTSGTHLVMSRGQPMAVSKELVEGPAERREGTPQARVVAGPFVQEQRIQCGVGMSQAPGQVS